MTVGKEITPFDTNPRLSEWLMRQFRDVQAQVDAITPPVVNFGSVSWTPGAIANGAQTSTSVTISGCVLGDFVTHLSCSTNSLGGLHMYAHVVGPNTVQLFLSNMTGGAATLASPLTFYIGVTKR